MSPLQDICPPALINNWLEAKNSAKQPWVKKRVGWNPARALLTQIFVSDFCSASPSVWNMAGKCPLFKSENEFRARLWSLRIEFQDWKNRICSGINRFTTYWKINRTRSCFIKVRKILSESRNFFFLVKSVQGDKRELSRRWNTKQKKNVTLLLLFFFWGER